MPGQTFAKSERLLSPGDFEKVRRSGKRLFTRNFAVYVLPNGLGFRRLGLSAGKKVGGAVLRNRIKRLLRESFRLHKDLFPQSSDILISVKSVDGLEKLQDVVEELLGAFSKKAPKAP